MAGYNGFSISNNAVAAYDDGLVPASKVPGVPAVLIKAHCRPTKWHHSSKNYNRTNFYNPAEVLTNCRVEWIDWSAYGSLRARGYEPAR